MTPASPISLERTSAILGWPSAEDVMHPRGAGPGVYADLVRAKIGRALKRFPDGRNARIGILTANPDAMSTEPPIAIVIEFQTEASEACLRELYRLAWNFSHSPALITIEPHLLRVWSCCEAPALERSLDGMSVHALPSDDLVPNIALERKAARALHWINLVSGEFFERDRARFNRNGCADQMLLGNLQDIREKLGFTDDEDDVCHDLLARIIFVQFLFDRKDTDGAAALDSRKLARLHSKGVLSKIYDDFASILPNYDDTYELFDWLNVKFNGDLFPGKGGTKEERKIGWAKEKSVVKPSHLAILADFIRGDLDMPSGQGTLWPQYAFDVIPLEFISSIYENFVTKRAQSEGIFYTPPHLVDFVLDQVLPWDGAAWDLKILDPACGSGIFLVKAFQRLVHRWKQAHCGQTIKTEVLRRLLERNLFGVDIDQHAVRVACFSLYLAMCDEIEPRHYWSQEIFPTMREQRLIRSDFFIDDRAGFSTITNRESYDIIVGNAPWGDSVITEAAKDWAKEAKPPWTVSNKDIGGLFLAKAAYLLKPNARLAMIQSANALLFNNSSTASRFRREIFQRHRISEIYNLSALRFKVFKRKSQTTRKRELDSAKTSLSPACVIIMHPDRPSPDERIAYISPKALRSVDEFTVIIEPQDHRALTVRDAVSDAYVWTTLMWGGARDRALVRRLQSFPTLASLTNANKVRKREGVIKGNRRKQINLERHRFFDQRKFEIGSFLHLNADVLPYAKILDIDSKASTDFGAFSYPQLIMKQSWQKASSRFEARLVVSSAGEGVVCNQSYVSAHGSVDILEAACMAFNSKVTVYFLQLTSGRIAAYRPEAQTGEIYKLPFPEPGSVSTEGMTSFDEIDARIFKAFGLKDAERVLVEDMFEYVLPDFRGDTDQPGHRPTTLDDTDSSEPLLSDYCRYVIRVLKAGFGRDRNIHATIFRPKRPLPYRLVAFELGESGATDIDVRDIRDAELIEQLERLDRSPSHGRKGHLYSQRVSRIYDSSTGTPTIYVLKPDQVRYWTRSVALGDGDEVALDLFAGFAKGVVQ